MAQISSILKSYRKSTKSVSVSESTLANVTEYLDSGSYAINRVLTGDISKGFPRGRISTLYGESASGKSLLVANAIIDALNNKNYQFVAYFDSEGGILTDYLREHNVDLSKIEHIPVHSIEDCAAKMLQLYDSLVKAAEEYKENPEENEEPKVLVVLDSYGALAADKLVADANNDKMVQDMGLGPKLKNNLMRGLMMRVVQSNCPLFVINHVYANPGALFTSKIKDMPGGEGIRFASHVILQMSKLLVKSNDTEFMTGLENSNEENGFYKGNRIRALCTKNRVVKPCFEATMYLDFNTGISKYDGLIEDAVKYGFIQEVRGGYIVPSYSEKKITYKTLVSSKEVWDTFIDKFNDESTKRMKYSTAVSDELDKIEAEIDMPDTSSGDIE